MAEIITIVISEIPWTFPAGIILGLFLILLSR